MANSKANPHRDVSIDPMFGHIQYASEILSAPFDFPDDLKKLGYIRIGDGGKETVINLDGLTQLFAMANLSEQKSNQIIRALLVALDTGDRLLFDTCVLKIASSVGIKGRGRTDIKQLLGAVGTKIMNNMQIAKRKLLSVGRRGEEESSYSFNPNE